MRAITPGKRQNNEGEQDDGWEREGKRKGMFIGHSVAFLSFICYALFWFVLTVLDVATHNGGVNAKFAMRGLMFKQMYEEIRKDSTNPVSIATVRATMHVCRTRPKLSHLLVL